MATPHPAVTAAPSQQQPQQQQQHRRSKTAILKSKLSPSKSPHKKTASIDSGSSGGFISPVDRASNPLNDYMRNPNIPPQLPTLSVLSRNGNYTHSPTSPGPGSSSYFDQLEPPKAPFVADHEMEKRGRRMHKKSLSTMSFSSTRKNKSTNRQDSPARAGRSSMDIGDRLRDLVSTNRGASRPPSPTKASSTTEVQKASSASSKMKKSKSAIDIGILRRKEKSPTKPGRKDKENLTPPSGLMGRARGSSDVVTHLRDGGSLDLSMFGGPGPERRSDAWHKRKNANSSESVATSGSGGDYGSSNNSSRRQSARSSIQEHDSSRRYAPADHAPPTQRGFPPPYESRLSDSVGRGSVDLDRSRGRSAKPKPRPKSLFAPKSPSTTVAAQSQRTSIELRRPNETSNKLLPEVPVEPKPLTSERPSTTMSRSAGLDLDGINAAFEKLLDSRDVPENRKDVMRKLPISVKQEFVRGGMQIDKFPSDAPPASPSGVLGLNFFKKGKPKNDTRAKSRTRDGTSRSVSPSKRSRPLSKTFGAHKDILGTPVSPTKKSKNDKSLPLSNGAHGINGPPSPGINVSYSPEEWVAWLKTAGRRRNFGQRMFVDEDNTSSCDREQGMKDVSKEKLHKLRLVLRNEALRWIEAFLNLGGMETLWAVIERVLGVEWREEHEDNLYHELLLCLKGLCTTSLALQKLAEMGNIIFPRLLSNLFDEDKKGPAEFTTRCLIISLLYMHLSTSPASSRPLRARRILGWLSNKQANTTRRPLDLEIFHSISSVHLHRDIDPIPYIPRPYQNWAKEVSNVTKEVFWIFLHAANIIPLLPPTSSSSSYTDRNFPAERPPQPAAAHVGGVEWEATTYLAAHLDLLNACIASLATREERNELREDLRNSGWEKVMGGALRLIKDKLHGVGVHDGLRTWVRASVEDGWDAGDVRFGMRAEPQRPRSPVKKKEEGGPPRLELDVSMGASGGNYGGNQVWEY